MRTAWLTRLGVATFGLVVAGFLVTGLSRLVVSTDTARALGAPLLFAGFLAAVATFGLAVLVWTGAVSRDA